MLQASLPSFTSTPTQEPPAPRNNTAYNIYIFNREGACLYYHEWSRPKPVQQGAGSEQDDQKMMFGLFFSLKTFTAAMDPRAPEGDDRQQLGAPLRIGEACGFHSFRANNYKLHFFESPSGLKIVLNTDPEVGDLREQLSHIYGSIYVPYAMKNPGYTPRDPIDCDLFAKKLHSFIKSLGL